VDVLRGLTVLLLVPNVQGGFSMREMAARYPDNWLWSALGTQFTHVDWVGAALWDLVMPTFVFLVGVAMALSTARKEQSGVSGRRLLAEAALRSASLFVLGVAVDMDRQASVWLELVPYTIVAAALPWAHWLDRWTGAVSKRRADWLDIGLPTIVVAFVGGWLASNPMSLGAYDFTSILSLMGLAYFPAFLLVRRPRVALAAVPVILGLTAMAYLAYSPAHGHGHWDNGSNAADAFDMWLLNALPRSAPYVGSPHGYHTTQCVPMIASMIFGGLAGRRIAQRRRDIDRLVCEFALAGLGGLIAAAAVAAAGIPLVKSLWTPSWVLFSSSLCVLMLAALMTVFDRAGGARLAIPLAALGTNALLLYVIASVHRWRIVMYGERVLGPLITDAPWRPLLQSLLVLAVLWALAAALYWQRIRVTL